MDQAFEVHMLNEQGKKKAREIAECFDALLLSLQPHCAGSPRYHANPAVEVDAFKIVEVSALLDNGRRRLLLDNGQHVFATAAMMAREGPEVGGYWVIQSDSYTYLNPKHVFERKYLPGAAPSP